MNGINPKIVLITTALVCITTVLFLYSFSNKNPNYKYNSFDRFWKHNFVHLEQSLTLPTGRYYFAGITRSQIYLAKYEDPFTLFVVNTALSEKEEISIKVTDSLAFRSITVMVDSPYFYLADGVIPFLLKGSLNNKSIALNFMRDTTYFINAIPISTNKFAFVSRVGGEYSLLKKTIAPSSEEVFPNLLERQTDGLIEKTGMLHFDKTYKRLIYLYYFRNQYLVADTNLNLLQKGHTIDTISHVKIKTAKITSENITTMAAPPLVVNLKSTVSEKYLYVNSNILSKNEAVRDFKNKSVIDVYNTETGSYLHSFYIPLHKENKMRSFNIWNNTQLFVLYDHTIVKYQLREDEKIKLTEY